LRGELVKARAEFSTIVAEKDEEISQLTAAFD
jgi:hypothetical protein